MGRVRRGQCARVRPRTSSHRGAAAHPARARCCELIEQGEIELVGAITEDSSLARRPAQGRGAGRSASLVVQSYTAEHQYTEEDRDLLAFVGQHVGAALSRARAIEETRQRNAELALINSVQAALAGELELQAIYDVVGDKIQEVFDAQVVDIGIYDEASGLFHFPYTIERGVRFPDEPIELIGFRKHVMETREPLMIDENIARGRRALRQPVRARAASRSQSALFVPLVVGGTATGVISLQNLDREHAFSDSDQQLLTTLAGSLSVALENARLVHETRQRNAELALINSVQDALAGELELQAIYDVVGDKIQEIFDAQVVDIGIYDEAVRAHPLPVHDRARRALPGRAARADSASASTCIETREPLLIEDSTLAAGERYGNPGRSTGEPPQSVLFVPLVVGGEATGRDLAPEPRPEHAFTESDVQLLTTLAGSLSVALENARLVHETRQRNAELALINSVQAGDRRRARPAGDLRRRRRQDPGGLRRPGRQHLDATTRRPGSSASRT